MNRGISLVLAAAALTASCADRTQDEWCRQKAEEEAARIDEVAGKYEGTLLSSIDGRPRGELTIEVGSALRVGAMPGCTGSTLRPVATGRITLMQGRPRILPINEGAYSSVSGALSARIAVSGSPGEESVLLLGGTLKDGTFSGTLEAEGYPEAGGGFNLRRTGPAVAGLPSAVISGGTGGVHASPAVGTYEGTIQYTARGLVAERARMVIISPEGTAAQEFLYSFLSEHPLGVTIQLPLPGIQIAFGDARLDERTGRIYGTTSGQSPIPGGGLDRYEAKLVCVRLAAGPGWSCEYTANRGVLFRGEFRPVEQPS
jgi:hypothetical protein